MASSFVPPSSSAAEHDAKRRKVRKGTHSCWECRRRKIRCQFSSVSDVVCIGCMGRGCACVSQDYVDDDDSRLSAPSSHVSVPPAPGGSGNGGATGVGVGVGPPESTRRMGQRLGRLEELMERLAERILLPAAPQMQGEQALSSRTTTADSASGVGGGTRRASNVSSSAGGTGSGSIGPHSASTPLSSESVSSSSNTGAAVEPVGRVVDVADASVALDPPIMSLLGPRDGFSNVASTRPAIQAGRAVSTGADGTNGTASTNNARKRAAGAGLSVVAPPLPTPSKAALVSAQLRAAASPFPPHVAGAIVSASPGAIFLASLFKSHAELAAGRVEPASQIGRVPPEEDDAAGARAHPTLIAKRLLQLAICVQQLAPGFAAGTGWGFYVQGLAEGGVTEGSSHANADAALSEAMARCVAAASSLVTGDDELVGSVEGLECLILQGFYHANAGNLRKAWLSFRRALSLAQLMGVDRLATLGRSGGGSTRGLKSVDPTADPAHRSRPRQLWYRIIFGDRYLSLILGLRDGTRDNDFLPAELVSAQDPATGAVIGLDVGIGTSADGSYDDVPDSALELLEKRQTILSGRIIERNHAPRPKGCAETLLIDCELEAAAKAMGAEWWVMPTFDSLAAPPASHTPTRPIVVTPQTPSTSPTPRFDEILETSRLLVQMHHFSLAILLHLPYMLRDQDKGRFDYSRVTCMRASRNVLSRFLAFRSRNSRAFSCRHVDYAALIAVMTLLLGYLGKPHDPMPKQVAMPRPEAPGINFQPAGVLSLEGKESQRLQDKGLAERVRDKMKEIAELNGDKLSRESAEIVERLMPIIDRDWRGGVTRGEENGEGAGDVDGEDNRANQDFTDPPLHLNVPYLGMISINPTAPVPHARGTMMAGGCALSDQQPSMPDPQAVLAWSYQKPVELRQQGGENNDDGGNDPFRVGGLQEMMLTVQGVDDGAADGSNESGNANAANDMSTSGDDGTNLFTAAPPPPSMYMSLDAGFGSGLAGFEFAPQVSLSNGMGGGAQGVESWFGHQQSHNHQQGQGDGPIEPGGDEDGGGGGISTFEAFPGFIAEADDWAFQGVDTTFWAALINGSQPNVS